MTRYAADTEVPSDRSRAEIERILERYGANSFMYGWQDNRAVIGFEINDRRFRILIPLPNKGGFAVTETGRKRTSQDAMRSAYEQATRQRWRAAALWIKAVLEAAESGIITLEEALQPFIVLPNGMTAGEWLAPQIEQAYGTGRMPPMLPGLPAPGETV
jgi:hypothetical protein